MDEEVRHLGLRLRDAVTSREVADLNGDHNTGVEWNHEIVAVSLEMQEGCRDATEEADGSGVDLDAPHVDKPRVCNRKWWC
ncbi:hypothetical protein AB0C06_04415 [Micromonospora inaquosa]|uniref:hypothetical protein n=1 Tax=Micromonospora inaquosa TaxID=2203716 RepID=UPI0033D23EA3